MAKWFTRNGENVSKGLHDHFNWRFLLGDENELLDLLETHTAKFCQPVPKTDPITYAKKGLDKK